MAEQRLDSLDRNGDEAQKLNVTILLLGAIQERDEMQ
jgi:hypothetical protein